MNSVPRRPVAGSHEGRCPDAARSRPAESTGEQSRTSWSPERTVIHYQHTRCSGGSFPKRSLAASFLARTWFHQPGRSVRKS